LILVKNTAKTVIISVEFQAVAGEIANSWVCECTIRKKILTREKICARNIRF